MAEHPQQPNTEWLTCFLCPATLPRNGIEPEPTQTECYPIDDTWSGPFVLKEDHAAATRIAAQGRILPNVKWAHRDCKRWAERIMRFDDFPEDGMKAVSGHREVEENTCVAGCGMKGAFIKCCVFTCAKYVHYRCLRTVDAGKRVIWKKNCVFLCNDHTNLRNSHHYDIYKDDYQAPDGFAACTLFPPHILAYATQQAEAVGQDLSFDHLHQTIFTDWPHAHRDFFDSLMSNEAHVIAARNCDAQAQGLYITNSYVQHGNAGYGLFASAVIPTQTAVARFFGTIIYRDLQQYQEQDPNAEQDLYGPPGYPWLQVSLKRFTNYGMQVSLEGKVRKKLQRNHVWIVPPKFCAAAYVNSWEYQEGDQAIPALLANQIPAHLVRRPSVHFVAVPESISEKRDLERLRINALSFAQINLASEIYADYKCTWKPPAPAIAEPQIIDVDEED